MDIDLTGMEAQGHYSLLDLVVKILDRDGYDIVAVTPILEAGDTTHLIVTAKFRVNEST
jgi:hypothetical protein